MARGFVAARRRLSWPLILFILILHIGALYGLARLLVPDMTRSVEQSVASVFTVTITAPPDTPEENEPVPDEGAEAEAGQDATPSEVIAPIPQVTTKPPDPLPQASSTGSEVDSERPMQVMEPAQPEAVPGPAAGLRAADAAALRSPSPLCARAILTLRAIFQCPKAVGKPALASR